MFANVHNPKKINYQEPQIYLNSLLNLQAFMTIINILNNFFYMKLCKKNLQRYVTGISIWNEY